MQQNTAVRQGHAVNTTGRAVISEPPASPTPHTPWCQPEHCRADPGMDATHRHLIGQSAGVEVWVERPDITRPDHTHQMGVPAVHLFSEGHLPLRHADLDALRPLLAVAGVFADELAGVR